MEHNPTSATARKVVAVESGGPQDFWGSHRPEDYRTSDFLTEDQVTELINNGTVLEVTDVEDEDPTQYGMRRIVDLVLDGAVVKKSFTVRNTKGEDVFAGRALLLDDMAAHFARGGASIPVRFFWAGKAIGLEPAAMS